MLDKHLNKKYWIDLFPLIFSNQQNIFSNFSSDLTKIHTIAWIAKILIMKNTLLLITFLSVSFSINAQKKLKVTPEFDMSTSFNETKKKFKSIFDVTKTLTLKDGSKLYVGDTIPLGSSASKISNTYETIFIGKITIGGAIMGVTPVAASTAFKRNTYVLQKIRIYSSMGTITAKFELLNVNATGLAAKYVTAGDLSIENGEMLNPNAPLTREEAIAKLKEAQDLMGLCMMSKEDIESLKAEWTPIIMKQ